MTRRPKHLFNLLTLSFFMALIVSCSHSRQAALKASKADSLIFASGQALDYERVIFLADSLEKTGDISPVSGNRWRGVAYYYKGQLRAAEFYYMKVVESEIKTENDELNYYKSARRLASILLGKGDYEGSLRIAIAAITKMQETNHGSEADAAMLLNTIGCCQLHLGKTSLAPKYFERAYQSMVRMVDEDTTGRVIYQAFVNASDRASEYMNLKFFEEASHWLDRCEDLIAKYEKLPKADVKTYEENRARTNMKRAVVLQGLGKVREAAQAYRAAQNSDYAKSPEGRLACNDYLMAANRFDEAARNFQDLDRLLEESGVSLTMENIQSYLLPKYRANVEARQKDSALAVGIRICNALDSAIVKSRQDDAAELAELYDTQQKEAQIAQQQADLTYQRLVGTGVALVLAMTFFVFYTLHKREATHRLAAAHQKLREAYDQLEETTAAKERIESELRIARDIQMSMVPNVFPDRQGLDMYAYIAPAKEVGGDLYGYLLQGNELYYCLGDVSGKGVPASLFMAQAIRLFRILASQHMMPAEIATRINSALTDDNEQGMFVTMFIGLIDLVSGKMEYCNAGHNPPVVGGNAERGVFLDMIPNAPIGLWPDLQYEGETFDNIKGHPILLYSDGLNEAENLEQEQFGDEQILEVLRSRTFENSREIITTLVEAVEKHRNGAEPNDDITMLCLKIA